MLFTWMGSILGTLVNGQSTDLAARLAATVFPVITVLVLLGLVGNGKPKSHYPMADPNINFGGLFGSFRQQQHFFKAGCQMIRDAYKRFPDTIWTVPCHDRTLLVLPPRFLEEIRDLPESVASLPQAVSDGLVGKWTTVDYDMLDITLQKATQAQYISKIGQQVAPTSEEVEYAMNTYLNSYKDYTPIVLHGKAVEIVTQMASRTVVGTDLCRNPDWLTAALEFARNIMVLSAILRSLPTFVWPLVAPLTPSLYSIWRCRRTMTRLMRPTIEQKIAWRRDRPESWAAHVKTGEMLTLDWMVEIMPLEQLTADAVAHRVAGTMFASIHTTAAVITNALLDLASDHDRWAPELRDEIATVLGGRKTRDLTNADMPKTWLLDSFLKESQRLHAASSQLNVNRKMLQQFTFSTGDVIPKNAYITFPSGAIAHSEQYYENPHEFDGFRFARLRRDAANNKADCNQNALQLTSSYEGSQHFGYGRHICPGRFQGSLISKLVMIEFLQRYDVKLGGSGRRPDNIPILEWDSPDPKAEILVRDRAV
ncbi:hypothetical protein E4U55_008277 [Claviceps digitariae]|nr:hypothetical protein E4U55_008277 [Claviceps digitariae]